MRRPFFARGAALALILPALCLRAAAQEAEGAAGAGDPWLLWKWVNFLILFAGLGYLISRSAGAFFRSRTGSIQKGITDAATLRRDAEAKSAEITRKIAGLDQEVGQLRVTAKASFAAEGQRIERETGRTLEHIRQQGEHEIATMAKNARIELQAHTGKLALEFAMGQLRETLTAEDDRALIDGFLRDLGERAASAGPRQ